MPPIMSVIQCTPEKILPITINEAKALILPTMAYFKALFLILGKSSIIALTKTVKERIVVDEGYEASSTPSINMGR